MGVPILSTWWQVEIVNLHFQPHPVLAQASWWTMAFFQISYGWFLVASDCIFLRGHGTSTYLWIFGFAGHSLIIAWISRAGDDGVARIILRMGMLAIVIVALGFTPTFVPGMISGFGAYVFWLGEAASLAVMFGVTPVLLLCGRVDGTGPVAERGLTHQSLPRPMDVGGQVEQPRREVETAEKSKPSGDRDGETDAQEVCGEMCV